MKLNPSELFKVLSVDTRIKIIELLKSKGAVGSKNISEILGITPAAVSQHLKILRQAGLVNCKRNGYWIPYTIDEKTLENCRCILNEVCTCGCHEKTGFKKSKIEFQDILYQSIRSAGSESAAGSTVPVSLEVGYGTRPAATQRSRSGTTVWGTEGSVGAPCGGDEDRRRASQKPQAAIPMTRRKRRSMPPLSHHPFDRHRRGPGLLSPM